MNRGWISIYTYLLEEGYMVEEYWINPTTKTKLTITFKGTAPRRRNRLIEICR